MKNVDVNAMMTNFNILIAKSEKYDEIIKEQGSINSIKQKAERFYSKSLTADVVAKLHSVTKPTVLKYVKMGLIPKHPDSTDGKTLIRASDAMVLDFDELQKQSKR